MPPCISKFLILAKNLATFICLKIDTLIAYYIRTSDTGVNLFQKEKKMMQETQLAPYRRNIEDPLCDSSTLMAPFVWWFFVLKYLSDTPNISVLMRHNRYDTIRRTLSEYVPATSSGCT